MQRDSRTTHPLRRLSEITFIGLLATMLVAGLGWFSYVSLGMASVNVRAGEESLGQQLASSAETGRPLLEPEAYELRKTTAFDGWWGSRPGLSRAGGDYLAVLRRHKVKSWTSSWVLGALVERQRQAGWNIEELFIPEDAGLLYTAPDVYSLYPRADGSSDTINHAVFRAHMVRRLTPVPLVKADYDPVLTPQQATAIEREYRIERFDSFYVVEPATGTEGAWVLHADPRSEYTFFLMPRSVSPAGDRL